VNPVALFALLVASTVAVALWIQGRRYVRRYAELHHRAPPAMWMFQKTDDPELERPRQTALILLPFFLVALAVYLLRP